MRSHSYLFRGEPDLDNYLRDRESAMAEAVDRPPEDHARQADPDAWAKALAESHAAQLPELGELWMDRPAETKVDVSWDHFRRAINDPSTPFYIPGYRTTFHLPFDGDPEVFRRATSTWTTVYCEGTVRDGELIHSVEYPHDTPLDLDGAGTHWRQQVEQWLGYAARQIEPFNASLERKALQIINNRKARIEQHIERLSGTSIPIGPPSERDKQSISDVIVRRPSPTRALDQTRTQTTGGIQLLPDSLQDEVFDHILQIIRDTGQEMEKRPGTYEKLDEEERRNVVINNLNGHYRGMASAEAFNNSGKTDILITFENKNLFVGECKIWSGKQSLLDATDQLFNYTTWRDTKAALVFFVGTKDFSAVVAKAKRALEEHDQFERWDAEGESEFRAVMRWPGDDARFVDLALTLFHVPDA